MKKNMGSIDRIIRAIGGIVLLVVSFLVPSLAWQIVLWIIAGILLITSSIGICPAYIPFHFSTKK